MDNLVRPSRPGKNGGTLLTGPTNKGGPGRPPDKIREDYRALFGEEGFARVKGIVTLKEEGDVLKAVDIAGKYGLGEAKTLINPEVIDRFKSSIKKFCKECPGYDPEHIARLAEIFEEELLR